MISNQFAPLELVFHFGTAVLEEKEAKGLKGTDLNLNFPQNFGTSIKGHMTTYQNTQQCDLSQHNTELSYEYASDI